MCARGNSCKIKLLFLFGVAEAHPLSNKIDFQVDIDKWNIQIETYFRLNPQSIKYFSRTLFEEKE